MFGKARRGLFLLTRRLTGGLGGSFLSSCLGMFIIVIETRYR